MRFDITDYMWEIFQISSHNHVRNIRVAYDLFITNLELKQNRYKGCPKISYKKLGNQWNELSDLSKEFQQIKFNIITQRSYLELYDKYAKGRRDQFDELCSLGQYLEGWSNKCTW